MVLRADWRLEAIMHLRLKVVRHKARAQADQMHAVSLLILTMPRKFRPRSPLFEHSNLRCLIITRAGASGSRRLIARNLARIALRAILDMPQKKQTYRIDRKHIRETYQRQSHQHASGTANKLVSAERNGCIFKDMPTSFNS